MTDDPANAASLPDEQSPEWTEADFAAARPARDLIADVFGAAAAAALPNRGGRPPKARRKAVTTLRLDADVLERWQNSGKGWQTRVNLLLRAYAPPQNE